MIKTNIKKLATNIGFPNIKIAIEILVNDTYEYETQTKLLIDTYNYIYIPIKFFEKDNVDNTFNNYDLFTDQIFIKESLPDSNIFVPYFDLYVKNDNNYIGLKGIFIPDEISLFMRSSIITFNQLFLKRKHLETLIENELSRNILRSLSIGEIITYTTEKILIKERANRYVCKGRFSNFPILQKCNIKRFISNLYN